MELETIIQVFFLIWLLSFLIWKQLHFIAQFNYSGFEQYESDVANSDGLYWDIFTKSLCYLSLPRDCGICTDD